MDADLLTVVTELLTVYFYETLEEGYKDCGMLPKFLAPQVTNCLIALRSESLDSFIDFRTGQDENFFEDESLDLNYEHWKQLCIDQSKFKELMKKDQFLALVKSNISQVNLFIASFFYRKPQHHIRSLRHFAFDTFCTIGSNIKGSVKYLIASQFNAEENDCFCFFISSILAPFANHIVLLRYLISPSSEELARRAIPVWPSTYDGLFLWVFNGMKLHMDEETAEFIAYTKPLMECPQYLNDKNAPQERRPLLSQSMSIKRPRTQVAPEVEEMGESDTSTEEIEEEEEEEEEEEFEEEVLSSGSEEEENFIEAHEFVVDE